MKTERLVDIMRSATEEVFSMMLGLPVEAGTAYTQSAGDESFDGVVGLIGLAGTWVGAGRISCTAPFACRLSTALLATEYTSVNEDVLDAMAELTNMIIGSVKTRIEEECGPMGLSIPTVIFGRNYKARTAGGAWTVVPFLSGTERLDVKVCLVPGSEASVHRPEVALHQAI
jgi:chemotaxis protein CheX